MKYDYTAIYHKNAAALERRPRLKKGVLLYNAFAPYAFALAYALLLGHAVAALSPKALAMLLALPASALLAVTCLRLFIERPRPYGARGAGITPLKEKKGENHSFPSRHLCSGAVIATCFLPYFPLFGAALFLLLLGLGYARFAAGWHYPSDLAVGALLGVAFGSLLFIL